MAHLASRFLRLYICLHSKFHNNLPSRPLRIVRQPQLQARPLSCLIRLLGLKQGGAAVRNVRCQRTRSKLAPALHKCLIPISTTMPSRYLLIMSTMNFVTRGTEQLREYTDNIIIFLRRTLSLMERSDYGNTRITQYIITCKQKLPTLLLAL